MAKLLLLFSLLAFLSCGGRLSTIEPGEASKKTDDTSDEYAPSAKEKKPNRTAFPVKSFVKIRKTLHILECKKIDGTVCKKGDKFGSMGSGISIGKARGGSLLLTAGHVCHSALSSRSLNLIEKYEVIITATNINNEEKKSVIVHHFNESNKPDLCLLFSKDLDTEGVLLAAKAPEVGEEVFGLSAPAGIFHPPTFPIISGRYSGLVDKDNAMVTVPAVGGSSGSGILNEDMRLVGILFATHPAFNVVTLTSNYHATAIFLNNALKKFAKMDI